MATETEQIKQNVVNHLCWDGRVDASDIQVRVDGSRVTLSGTVPTHIAREAAMEAALYVDGVNSVANQITVAYPAKSSQPTNVALKHNVESTLKWNPVIKAEDIQVAVNQGVVTLTGSVDAFWKKVKAERLASQLNGVLQVDNKLAVEPLTDKPDAKIADDIKAALVRMGFLYVGKIDIQVKDGVVSLSGTVPDRVAYCTAYDAAKFTGGVTAVIMNKLHIEK